MGACNIFEVSSQLLFSQLLLGLINGAFYAMLSLGLAVIFGMLNVINFTHGAQYMMGGVKTDLDGATTVPGLFAAGEVACCGVHGANRLASTSLLEGLVFGARAAAAATPGEICGRVTVRRTADGVLPSARAASWVGAR